MSVEISNNKSCWVIEKKEPSSLEERLKEKIKQNDVNISDLEIRHALDGQLETPIGKIDILTTRLQTKDYKSNIGVRLGIGRDNYKVPTGIYAIGQPNSESPVLVTANYKLTIDKLRIMLEGLNLWILVIDTQGVNVWCAAGKGTFSTEEIIFRIQKSKLKKLVTHNQLILPQLGAPGVSAFQITKYTGFKVVYGPIYAKDIKEFINNDYKATKEMRRVGFNLKERITVTPIEAVMAAKYIPIIYIFFVIMQFIGGEQSINQVLWSGLLNTLPYIIAIMIGTIIFPILLPILPFRMFSMKAGVLGIIWSLVVILFSENFHFDNSSIISISNLLMLTSIISFLGMSFTGSTTFTSLSGVKKEIKLSVPVMIVSTIIGISLMTIKSFL